MPPHRLSSSFSCWLSQPGIFPAEQIWNSAASPRRRWPPSLPLLNVPLLQLLLPLPAPPPSPLPLRARQPVDPGDKALKVSQAVWLRGDTASFSLPSAEEGGSPPTPLTCGGEVIPAGRGVAGVGASGQQQGFQVHPAVPVAAGPAAHAGCGSPCPGVLSWSGARSPGGGLLGSLAASAASKPHCSSHSLLPGSH